VHLKDHRLQYAITWFGLAGAVVIAFAAWWPFGQKRGGNESGNEGKTAFRTSHQRDTSMHAGV
jgi:cytochrome oxidase assembly protein ShyY1